VTDLEIPLHTKQAALSLLRRGLVTLAEASRLSGASVQRIQYWTRDLDLKSAREAVLARLWRQKVGK
jgi:hypothetical protein